MWVLLFGLSAFQSPKTFPPECDTIVMKSGEEVSVKVVKIGTSEIEYKKCENIEGPLYSAKKQDVFMIKYANGTKELIKNEDRKGETDVLKAEKSAKPSFIYTVIAFGLTAIGGVSMLALGEVGVGAWIGAVLGILFGIPAVVLLIIGLALAISSLVSLKKYPDKLSGKGFAITALIISAILLAVPTLGLSLLGLGLYFLISGLKKKKRKQKDK